MSQIVVCDFDPSIDHRHVDHLQRMIESEGDLYAGTRDGVGENWYLVHDSDGKESPFQ